MVLIRVQPQPVTIPPVSNVTEAQLDPVLQATIEALQTPVSWGDVAGSPTWADVYNQNATWAIAGNHTWGALGASRTWQFVYDSGKTWTDALNYTWETL